MANKIFRSLISTVLVICLMHFQTSIALAETKGVTEEKGVVKTAADGKKSQSVAYTFSDVDESSMMATLTMIGIGFFSVAALKGYKPITMDMKVALGAGAIYVAGEVYSNISLKDKLEKMRIEFEKKSGESMQTQLEAFTDLKTAYTEAKKTIETKNMLQTAAAAAYATAGGIAAYQLIKEKNLWAAFLAKVQSIVGCASTVGIGPTSGVTIAQVASVNADAAAIQAAQNTPGPSAGMNTKIKGLFTKMQTTLASMDPRLLICKAPAEAEAQVLAGNTAIWNSESLLGPMTTWENIEKRLNNYMTYYIYKLFINKAEASWNSTIALLGTAGATYLAATKTSLGALFDKHAHYIGLRALIWTGLAGLTAASLSANKKVIKDLDERIKKIDDIIASLTNVENGAKIADSSNSKVNKTNLLKGLGSNTILANAGSSNFKMDCVTSDASTNCPSLAKAITESPEFQELPITLQNLSQKTGNLGDALQGQSNLSDSALASAGELGAQNNAIQNALKDSITKTKKLDNASDLDKAMDDAKNNLLAASKNAADKAGGARGLYASLGGIPSNSAGNLNQAKNIAKESQFAPTDSKAGTVAGVKAKAKNNDFEFKLMNENKEVAGTDSPVNVDNDQLASEISKESIGSSNGPSIFEILSHRYYVSGYPKLLEEE